MSSIHTLKTDLRARLKQLRHKIPDPARQQKNLAIQQNLLSLAEIQIVKSIFCFISYGTEVNTHGIIDQFLANGKQLAVPKIMDSGQMIAVHFQDWDELQPGQLGILTPRTSVTMTERFDITITPGLGFSEKGERLGFGKGYYDQWFQANDVGMKVALAYEAQIVADLPTDDHDIKVDMIITEDRLIRI